MIVEEILARAADEVEKGWCQGRARDDAGNVCLIESIVRAMKAMSAEVPLSPSRWDQLYGAIISAVRKELGGERLPQWNDAPGRIKEEVATVLRNAKRHVEVTV